MRVQIIFTSSYPVGQVSTNRVHYLCKGLVENGVNLELLISNPTETSGLMLNREAKGLNENIRFHYAGNILIRHSNKVFSKIIDIYCHFLTIGEMLLNINRFDVFIVIGSSFDFRLFLPIVARLINAKIVLEINEYPFVTKKNNIVTKTKRFLFLNTIFPLYDGYIVISSALDGLVKQYKSKRASSIVVPILGEYPSEKNCDCELPISVPYIIHAGSMLENKDGLLGILQAFKVATRQLTQPIKFVITGSVENSKEYNLITDFISNNGLADTVIFTGFLDRKKLECYLVHSSLAIINKYNNIQNRFCFPTKLVDYLKYDVPLVVTSVGELSAYLENEINACIIEPGDIDLLATKIKQAFTYPKQFKTMAQNGKLLLKGEFNYLYQGEKLSVFLSSLAGR